MRNSRLGIIIEEVYKKNVFSWSFVMLLLSPILMVAVVAIISAVIGMATASDSIGSVSVVGASEQTASAIEAQDQGQNILVFDQDLDQAEEALKNEEIDGYLVIEESDPEDIHAQFYRTNTGKNISTNGFQSVLESIQLSNRSEALGLSEEESNHLLDSNVAIENQTINLDSGTTESSQDIESMLRTGVAYAVSFIVFMFVMNYISIISQEIAVEKGSRIMEIVLSSISSTTHFMGKMLGIFLVLLTQVAFYAILLAILVVTIMNTPLPAELQTFLGDETIPELISATSSILIWSGVLAFLGIITYSVLGAFLGSLVSNVQDVNKMITPIILLSLVGFYIGMFGLGFSNNILVRVASQVPFFTPFVMPFRIAAETVSTTELVLSVIFSLLFSILCLWVSANFYKSNVLTYSDKGIFGTLKQSYTLRQSEKKV
ncbi:ABC transporter permease [Aerococcaceae bacterium 50-4]